MEKTTFEDTEWYKIDPGRSGESLGLIYNQFAIIQVHQRSPILQTSNCTGTFFCCFLQQTGSSLQDTSMYLGMQDYFFYSADIKKDYPKINNRGIIPCRRQVDSILSTKTWFYVS